MSFTYPPLRTFPQQMQLWGVWRCSGGLGWWGRGGWGAEKRGQRGRHNSAKPSYRRSDWRANALLLQTMNHSWCQLGCAHHMPVILSNTLVAILCQAPYPTFCQAWNLFLPCYTGNKHSVKQSPRSFKCLQLCSVKCDQPSSSGWIHRLSLKVRADEPAGLLCRLCNELGNLHL